jgi:predicted HicB family RNase H-like nuclease
MDQQLTLNVNLSLRIPRDIHRAVKHRAVRARRSLNGEIIHRLEQSLMAEEAGN